MAAKQPSPALNWCLTINNPHELEPIRSKLKEYCVGYCFQLEQGEQGTIHLQG